MPKPFDNPQHDKLEIAREQLMAVVPMEHWLSTRSTVTLAVLAESKLVLVSLDQ